MSEENTNKETAEIIKDLQNKPQIPIKGNTADFLKRFAKNPDGSDIQPTETEDVVEDVIDSDNEEKKPLIQPEKKKPGFVQKQIEENKRLKEELEKSGIPVLQIEEDFTGGNVGQIRTRVEAFVEML